MNRLARLLLILAAPALLAGTTWEDRLADRWQVVHIANGQLAIGVAPELGGRLVDFRLRRAAPNRLWLPADEHLRLTPAELAAADPDANHGGLYDWHWPGWPGPETGGETYACTATPDASAIAVAATVGGIEYRRTMTLLGESTTLRVELALINRRQQAVDLASPLRGVFRLGSGGNQAVMAGPGGHLVEFPYLTDVASPFESTAEGGWLALIDQAAETVQLIRYPAADADVIAYRPRLVGDPGQVTVDLLQRPRETPPGGQVAWWQEHSLYHGLTGIDLVHETTLIQVETEFAAYAPGERIVVRIGAARPFLGKPFPVELANGSKVTALTFACRQPGIAEWQEVPIPEGFAADGQHTLELRAFGRKATVAVTVDGPRLDALNERRLALHRRIGELGRRPGLAKQTETQMARIRLLELDRRSAVRDLPALERLLEPLENDVQRWLAEDR